MMTMQDEFSENEAIREVVLTIEQSDKFTLKFSAQH